MSFTGIFSSVVEAAPCHDLWTDVLRGDDPLVAFEEFRRRAISRFKTFDDRLVSSVRSFVSAWAKHFGVPEPRLFFHRASGGVLVGSVDGAGYRAVVGEWPSNDDLHRVNCDQAGAVGHAFCGWCAACETPRFLCGHLRFA